ncbi:hypothetical protein HN51_015617 [Arachis hypogaea]|nr:uncharacterized protein DS421_6g184540 [Arachis hypogaea]
MDQTLAPNYKQKRNSNPKKNMIRRSKSISNSGPRPHYSLQQPPLLPLPTHAHYPLLPKPGTTMIHNVESNKRTTHYYSSFSSHSLTPPLPVASTPSSLSSTTCNIGHAMLSSNVLSPPPSSLPLPKFCIRSKLSCKAKTGCALRLN